MAVSLATLPFGAGSGDPANKLLGEVYTTASWTPTLGRVAILAVGVSGPSAVTVPIITGNGLEWTVYGSRWTPTLNRGVFLALAEITQVTAGAITIENLCDVGQAEWWLGEFAGVQPLYTNAPTVGDATSNLRADVTVPLWTPSTGGMFVGAAISTENGSFLPDEGWTGSGAVTLNSPPTTMGVMTASTHDGSAVFTFTKSGGNAAVVLELLADTSGLSLLPYRRS